MENEKKYFAGWFMWVAFLLIGLAVLTTGLRYFGLIGQTVVERIVFEESFQYKEGMKQRNSTLEKALAEVDLMVIQGSMSSEEATAQKRVLRIQLGE